MPADRHFFLHSARKQRKQFRGAAFDLLLRHRRKSIAALLLAVALWQIGEAAWIPAKAWLAQFLIADAWQTAMAENRQVPPWPWADTAPVARLQAPALAVDQIVLAHATGRTLAFGPGHLDGSALPGDPGLSVISGHRDTSFAFLAELAAGAKIQLQKSDGAWLTFRVTAASVIDQRKDSLPRVTTGAPQLALVTCYPFDAVIPGGPLRYVVYAELDDARPLLHPRID
jgi:sortase A